MLKLIRDIEPNPGPEMQSKMTVITLNCRGLGDVSKMRLLLNGCYRLTRQGETIILLQETMITSSKYIELAWRSNFVFTPGTGNSKGCVTLLSRGLNADQIEHRGHRGHSFTMHDSYGHTTRVYNIYAPNGFDATKTAFLHEIFQSFDTWDGDTIVGGDFNTTLSQAERHGRGITNAEIAAAQLITNYATDLNLRDCWEGFNGFTWQKGKKMSRLDRILYRLDQYEIVKTTTDLTLVASDHAAVIAQFKHVTRRKCRHQHVKLDNSVVTNADSLAELRSYLVEQLTQATQMPPQVKLEFAKMTIRTKALEITANNKRRNDSHLVKIESDIKNYQELLTRYADPDSQDIIVTELENLNREKNELMDAHGKKLALRARTRWYNEGEGSNKYFLNMLKRNAQANEMSELMVANNLITEKTEIREEVTDFYSQLYNRDMSNLTIDGSLFHNMFKVDQDASDNIDAPVNLHELWETLKSTKATTPGPDGISNTYLKKLWDILGPLIEAAWNDTLLRGDLMPSHKTSFLRLIPKVGKDKRHLKNWRPITLSNCDHKLITRLYNNRVLKAIGKHISPTQTAYIRGRNIADNLRLICSANKYASAVDNVNATIIALDAQKAFDSVSHQYISAVLEAVGLTRFVPIFKLLY
jgi:endonuclease/exonuclease/phosphatase (EEP) superfamily protein YafD